MFGACTAWSALRVLFLSHGPEQLHQASCTIAYDIMVVYLARAVAQVLDAVLSIAQSVNTCTIDYGALCYYASTTILVIRIIIRDKILPVPSATLATPSAIPSVR